MSADLDNRLIQPNRLYNRSEACKVLSCGETFLYSERAKGKLKVIKMGRKALFLGEHLLEYIHANVNTESKQHG